MKIPTIVKFHPIVDHISRQTNVQQNYFFERIPLMRGVLPGKSDPIDSQSQ